MAAIGKGNILLPGAAAIAVLVLGSLLYKAVFRNSPAVIASGGSLSVAPLPTSPDADSPSDTIRSLRGQVETLQTTIDTVNLQNDELKKQNTTLIKDRKALTSEMSSKIDSALTQQAVVTQGEVSGIESKIESISSAFKSFTRQIDSRLNSVEENTEVPVGLGLGSGTGAFTTGDTVNGDQLANVVWVNPLDVPPVADNDDRKGGGFVPDFMQQASASIDGLGKTSASTLARALPASNVPVKEEVLTSMPYYTLADLSALVDSTALTSLIGKVYLDDEIKNPYPFKIVVGRDNLTANFKELPVEIEGMIFEGYATGDWPLSCVRGTLNAATFVFNDGTVRSAYVGDRGSRPQDKGYEWNAIGYISDPWGNPCIVGERITDAPKFLLQRALLAGAEGYAAALKQEHIDTQRFVNPDGSTSSLSTFVGDAAEYAQASAYYGAVRETTDWIRERQRQSFDAIYVQSGAKMVINLQQELQLDLDPDGRKLDYGNGVTLHESLD